MLFNEKVHEFEIEGRKVSFSSGKYARRSSGSVFARMGETAVLVNVDSQAPKGEGDFFPMTVEYVEKLFAAGKISSSKFVKRERFPTDAAILRARMIDRSFRSRFPADYRNEVTITITVLSYDSQNDPLILAINAASAAIMLSKVPFDGPIAGVRIGLKDGNPVAKYEVIDETSEEDQMNYVASGDGKLFTMVDAGCHEVPENQVVEGMKYGLELMNPWMEAQQKFIDMFEVQKEEYTSHAVPEELLAQMKTFLGDEVKRNATSDKPELTTESLEKVYKEYEGKYSKVTISEAYYKLLKKEVRAMILDRKERIDGRKVDEIRELDMEVGVLPRVHGSSLFTRGMTQSLTVATLGNTRDQRLVEDIAGEELKSYMHFYDAMPFSLGEAGRIKWIPGRRETGHSALAEKALAPVVPSLDEFPYTVLLVSEVLSQNGSSSMAATCASTLALMDAGVPIKRPVAGIAMGVITDDEGEKFQILTDIRDVEDFYGDMDFKVTGTTKGITAVQMDNKAAGLPIEVFEQAIAQARQAREFILEKIEKVIASPRAEVSKYAPKVLVVKIPVEKIGELIGPGGKNIKELSEGTGCQINVEDDGTVQIFGDDMESIEKANKYVSGLAFVPEVGGVYKGVVDGVMEYGAFVEIAPNVSGLVHVSEMSNEFVKDVRDFVTEGQEVEVKILDIGRDGKIKMSMKAVKGEATDSGEDRPRRRD
ncbi:polyribonucleotide nucleotidyltransferase [bacterium]|nr:polyribonucleotide nucleotidyltransferase [bacterium]